MRLGGGGQLTTLAPSTARPRAGGGDRLREALLRTDWLLLLLTLAISGFGVYVIRAATRTDIPDDPGYYFTRSVAYVLLGVAALVVAASIDPDRLSRAAWMLWGGLLGALAVVFAIGTGARGSVRWIELGAFRLQPSELGKAALALVLAGLIVERARQVGSVGFTLLGAGVAGVPMAIVFVQPDLGTSMVYAVILLAALFVAGVPWTHFAAFGAVIAATVAMVLVVLPGVGIDVLQPYQMDRLTSFVDSSGDRGDTGYQLEQSKTAIGSGGALGKGPDGATQTINDFLPEHHTDFIFAVVAEMFGFAGGSLLILAYALLCWRALGVVARATSQFDQVLAGSIVAMFAFQVFVNIGMTIGIMPITGIPLPFMSYGGSHTLTNFIAIGLLLAVNRRAAARV